MGCGGGDTEDVIVGYRYFVGVHMLLTQGPVDKFTEFWVGEDFKVFDGSVGHGTTFISDPDLFGGDEKQGGIEGNVHTQIGTGSQGRNSYLQGQQASDCPAYRFISGAVLESMYIGTSTYPKPWAFTAQRLITGWDGNTIWYSAKAAIGKDMNPAHIIYELLVSGTFGKGLPTAYIDDAAFKAAADTLYDESFGLSYLWGNDEEPEEFIKKVLGTINGAIFQDMTTGKYQLELARDDYTVGDLEIFNEDDIKTLEDFIRPAMGEVPNWVVIKYHDRKVNKQTSITVHDLAMMDKQGLIIPITHTYSGCCKKSLANELAGRQLLQYSSLLATMTVTGNRNMAHIRPNDMIKISWPYLGIVELPVRIISVDYGKLEKGVVTLKCSEDVFSVGQGIYDEPDDTLWQDPWNEPVDATVQSLTEMSYGMIIDTGFISQEVVDEYDPQTAGLLAFAAVKPTLDSIDYRLQIRNSPTSEFGYVMVGAFTPSALLTTPLTQSVGQTVLDLYEQMSLSTVEGASYCLIEDEFLELVSVDLVNVQITVKRGLWDTVPVAHAAGSRVWFFGAYVAKLVNLYAIGSTPACRPQPRTLKGSLPEDDATITTVTLAKRIVRPYSPGNFKINGSSYPSSFSGEPALTWSHRNRKTQLGTLITADDDGGFSLEAGEYYMLEIHDPSTGGGLLRTVGPFTDEEYTYELVDEGYDAEYGGVGNYFGDDANCQALYKMEGGLNWVDALGNSTLTAGYGSTEDAVNFKEGAAAAFFNSVSDTIWGYDNQLATGFPFKSTDTKKEFSLCGWVRSDSLPSEGGYRMIYSKYDNTSKGSIYIAVKTVSGVSQFVVQMCYSGGVQQIAFPSKVIAQDIWYHFGFTYDDADMSYVLRIWDDDLETNTEFTGNYSNKVTVNTSVFHMGNSQVGNYGWFGQIDEMVVFNDILTPTEIDLIRAGDYGPQGDPLPTGWEGHDSLRFVLWAERQDSTGVIYESWQSIDFTVARV